MWWTWLALACSGGGEPKPADDSAAGDTGPSEDSDATGEADDTGDTGAPIDTALSDCALQPVISLDGAAVPGQDARLLLSVAADAELSWLVPYGEVSADAVAGEAWWSIPITEAVHTDDAVTIEVTASGPGCVPETASLDVAVGHPEPSRVVVLYNPAVDGSADVAEAYAAARGLDDGQLCGVEAADPTTLDGDLLEDLADAVMDCVDAVGEHVHYLVPVYGVPYKVSGRIDDIAVGTKVTTSLDALLFFGRRASRMSAARYNPIYQAGDSLAGVYDPYMPIGHIREEAATTYLLVTRIDGASAEDALALIDRTMEAEALVAAGALDGIVYVDGRYGDTPPSTDDFGSYESGEWNMWGTRTAFEELGWYEVVWDGNGEEFGTAPAPESCPDALFYAGWYSYYNYNDAFTWAPGAVGGHLDSCSACDLRDGTWAAEALQRGITATFGAVGEPYVAGMPEYDQLFRYLTEGANYAESAYESTVIGAWMMTFVGDPLYRPFPDGERSGR